MAEDFLPDKINKLEIAESLPLVKLTDKHVPITMNPFYAYGIDAKNRIANSTSIYQGVYIATKSFAEHDLQQGTRTCRRCIRRSSESVLDEFKVQPAASLSNGLGCRTLPRITPGVNKQPMKKSSTTVGRKVVLREPILRALQSCFHMQSTARRKILSDNEPKVDHGTSSIKDSNHSKGMSDFRDLINECETMLQENVNFKTNNKYSSLSSKSLKKFSTAQAANLRTEGSHSPCSIIRKGTKTAQPFTVSAEPSTSSRANISCSQQAAFHHCTQSQSHSLNTICSGGTSDDVTIDELASYFETLVHIPKKMSSMAEMMYI